MCYNFLMTFGEKITRLRKEKGWSQKDLAVKINTNQAVVARYEKNAIKPSVEVAKKIADAFEASLDYLTNPKSDSDFLKDKRITERIEKIQKMPEKEQELVFHLIDAVSRDAHAKKAYSK